MGRRPSAPSSVSLPGLKSPDLILGPTHPLARAFMLEGFTRTEVKTSGARIVTVHGGKGPPVLLMHGNPFSHVSWHKVAPRLAEEFTVVATDLRGYGDSEKPPGGDDHSGYSFRTMAQDQVEVMAALGFPRFYAAGHDRGARVLHRMCLDHPEKVM